MDDVERAFREAHGQAVATLTRIFGDLTLAEDAVQDAFVTAVARWLQIAYPIEHLPLAPGPWLRGSEPEPSGLLPAWRAPDG